MLTKDDVLKEIPLKKRERGGEVKFSTWEDFKNLERIVKSQVMTEKDLELIKKEIVAKREALGLVLGVNVRRKNDDGDFVYVSAGTV